MTTQFRFTPAQRAAFRADPPGYAVGAADRVLTDIERIIGSAGVGPVEEFAFSDEDRAAVRQAVRDALRLIADAAGVSVDLDADDWVSDGDFTEIEAAINRHRAVPVELESRFHCCCPCGSCEDFKHCHTAECDAPLADSPTVRASDS